MQTAETLSLPAPPAAATNGRKRPGAPDGNHNRARHAVYTVARTGRVPLWIKGGHDIRRKLRKLGREVPADFERVHGRKPALGELALMHSLSRHEARAAILENRLAHEGTALTIPEFAGILEKIGTATDARDRALAKLGLDHQADESPWDFPALPVPSDDDTQDAPGNAQASERDAIDGAQAPDAAQRQCDSPSEARP